MKRRVSLLSSIVLAMLLLVSLPGLASAHGERAQEAFLKQQTTAWFDVKFSTEKVKQGEPLVITGTVKILETWPKTLAEPSVGFIGVTAPGPVMYMKERTVNGDPVPGSVYVKKGGVYEFRIVVEGRQPGRWHIHPIIAVEGAGSMIGPGQWIDVEAVPGFTKTVQLMDGQTINIETYGKWFVILLSVVGFAMGVWWMLYWTVRKRTVTRLAVTNQLELNDDGSSVGLITRKDHKFVNLVAAITVFFLVAGWGYAAYAYPTRIPQQVIRFEPPAAAQPAQFVQAKGVGATFDPDTHELVVEVQVTNQGKAPVQIQSYTTSYLTFANQAVTKENTGHVLTVPDGVVAPGQTKKIKLVMMDHTWIQDRMIPIHEPQMTVAGVLTFVDQSGTINRVTINASMVPTRFF
jgi:methane/ammonia monooxygenase subunit B